MAKPQRNAHPPRSAGSARDTGRIRDAALEFIRALGVLDDPRMVEASARRMAEAWGEDLLGGYRVDPASLLEPIPAEGERGLVVVRGIEFTALCVHHLLPFSGVAHVAYLPAGSLCGISKLARVVDALSRRLQIQERLTAEIVDVVESSLEPRGAGAVLEAEHLCMTARGIRSRGSRVVTTAWSGALEEDAARRETLLELIGRTGA